jgi:hypothetical protein
MKYRTIYAGDLDARIHNFLHKKFAQFPDLSD